MTNAQLLFSLICISICFGKIYENVAELARLEYDFVMVGGGTAGLVVANRLTENTKFSVLVLEASVLDSTVPFLVNDLLAPNIYEWNYTTTPQSGLNGRALPYLRAHMLGGCSAHNLMFYTRGPKDDFDRYAKLTGDAGWSWNRIFPYFLKELPAEFPFNLDMNSGKPLGVGWLQSTIGEGKRSSSASSHLAPFVSRKNLHVLLHAQVTRLVNASHERGKLAFGGIKFLQSGSSRFIAKARKEIILSAGTIGTPHILMHSGIGDGKALHALGIIVFSISPAVAKIFRTMSLHWNLSPRVPQISTKHLPNGTRPTRVHSSISVLPHVGWLRLDLNSEALHQFPDPSVGRNTAHIELIFSAGFSRRSASTPQGHFMNIGTVMVTPLSRGSIILNSSNPFDSPLINPRYLTSDFDLFVLRNALKRAQRFVTAPVWKDYILAPTFIRNNAGTISHLVGSAAMSARGARYGVVDPDLIVKGATRLSIIDASVLVCRPHLRRPPIVPSAHTQSTAYIIAERGADLVKARWT
ncbi:aryl-alcohol-oxidase from pleurotus Eryingii [Mycena olivaceomarginata]|nr:aryl-alcohol-oxidase from pleurotus Eryingii [Mycena olivaceomarginata]